MGVVTPKIMWAWRIGKVAGIDLRIHFSFLLILLLGAMQWGNFGARGAVFGAVLTLLTFASVTLHELGHAVVARAFGIPVKDITLYPIGGIASLGKRPRTPGQELLIALAGPAVNVVLAVMLSALGIWLYGLEALQESMLHLADTQPTVVTLLVLLMTSNAVLALFNMIPALPMDGGRVLRAVLSWFIGPERGTSIAAMVAKVLAVALFGLGLVYNPMLAIIAVFVFMGAGQEVQQERASRVLDTVPIAEAMNPYAPRFGPATTLSEALQMVRMTHYHAVAIEHGDRLLGVVEIRSLIAAINEQGPWAYVAGIAQRAVPRIDAGQSLEMARSAMSEAGLPYVAVFRDELFMGLLTELELALVLRQSDRPKGMSNTPNARRWGQADEL